MSPYAKEVMRHLCDWSLHEPADPDEPYRLAEIIAAVAIFCALMVALWFVMGTADGTTFY